MRYPVIFAVAVLTLAACYGGTESAEKVTRASATLTAWGVPQTTATDAYFEYSTTDVFTSPKKSPEIHPTGLTVGQTYPIAIDVTGLSPDTRYWYRLCGKEQSETTYNCAPSVRSFITSTFTNPVATGADIKVVHFGSSFHASGTGCPGRCAAARRACIRPTGS